MQNSFLKNLVEAFITIIFCLVTLGIRSSLASIMILVVFQLIVRYYVQTDKISSAFLVIAISTIYPCFSASRLWIFYVIVNIANIFFIIEYLDKKKELMFADHFGDIVEKYNKAMTLLKERKDCRTYKAIIDRIYKEDKKLFFASLPVRDALKQVNKLIEDLSGDDTFKPKKKMFVRHQSNEADKEYNTNKYMKSALEKKKEYEVYIARVDSAINDTGTDFLNVRAELELSKLDSFKLPELNLNKLEEKSRNLAYIQKHIPLLK